MFTPGSMAGSARSTGARRCSSLVPQCTGARRSLVYHSVLMLDAAGGSSQTSRFGGRRASSRDAVERPHTSAPCPRSRILINSATMRIPMVRASPRHAPFDSNSPVLVLCMLEPDPSAACSRCSRARSAQGCACPCAQDASSTSRSHCFRAARPAAASGGRAERPSRCHRCRRPRAALRHHRPAALARVLLDAGLRRVQIGGRARRDAHVRVRERRRRGEVGRLCGGMRSVHVRSGSAPLYGAHIARCRRATCL